MIHKILYNKKILKEEFKDENKSIYTALFSGFIILLSTLMLFACSIIDIISYLNLFSSFFVSMGNLRELSVWPIGLFERESPLIWTS